MFRCKLSVTALSLLLAGYACYGQDDFQWRKRLVPPQSIEIKGVNGDLIAEPSTTGEVEVTASKKGRRSDPAEVRIEVVEHAGGATICAVYPSPSSSEPNECKPGSEGRMNTRNNDVNVNFHVRLPAGIAFVGRTVNGKVEATSMGSEVEARTVNGAVRISTSESALAKTVNGSITASLGKSRLTKPAEFDTVNGGIIAELPAGAGAEIEAKTVNGGIQTDFPLTVQGKFGGRHISGRIGSGGPKLALKTVNGGIKLRQSR